MKEIGGYLEFEHYRGFMLHEDAIKLNSGRNCLAYLIKTKKITKLAIPFFLCDCIEDICKKNQVKIRYYHIEINFYPVDLSLDEDEWLYLVNYYGQLSVESILQLQKRFKRIILDNAHTYFAPPIKGIDTLYTCRKFFGVPDGGILYTDSTFDIDEKDESFGRISFLAGRLERSASEFFQDMLINEEHFYNEPIIKMSAFTENMLHSFNYQRIKAQRDRNFQYLHSHLQKINQLNLIKPDGAFMYPLMIENASRIRELLINKKIYIPTLWPNVLNIADQETIEWKLTSNVLPLPLDQRYNTTDIDYMLQELISIL